MKNYSKKRFRLRSFISFVSLFSFVLLVCSAVGMYLRPEGSVAHWSAWTFLGLTKKGWEGVHTVISIAFVVFTVIHVVMNAKILWRYATQGFQRGLKHQFELIASLSLVGIIFVLALFQRGPVWGIMELRSKIKKGVHHIRVHPPESGFEGKTLDQVAGFLQVDVREVMEKLRLQGLKIDSHTETLYELSERNKCAPQDVYVRIIKLFVNP